jgi:hypothetical protein
MSTAAQVNATLDAALELARAAYHVFPLAPGSKVPLRGSRGCNDATTDAGTIRRWWAQTPEANVGLATGEPSG